MFSYGSGAAGSMFMLRGRRSGKPRFNLDLLSRKVHPGVLLRCADAGPHVLLGCFLCNTSVHHHKSVLDLSKPHTSCKESCFAQRSAAHLGPCAVLPRMQLIVNSRLRSGFMRAAARLWAGQNQLFILADSWLQLGLEARLAARVKRSPKEFHAAAAAAERLWGRADWQPESRCSNTPH